MLEQGRLHLSSFVDIILEALPVVLVKVLLQEFAVLDDAERNLSGGPESATHSVNDARFFADAHSPKFSHDN